MPSKPEREGERRLIHSAALLVSRYVQRNLPEAHRGLRAVSLDMRIIEGRVEEALNLIVADVTAQVLEELPSVAPEQPFGTTGRLSVLDNSKPCDECGTVLPVAVVTYSDGDAVKVECWRCSPELRDS